MAAFADDYDGNSGAPISGSFCPSGRPEEFSLEAAIGCIYSSSGRPEDFSLEAAIGGIYRSSGRPEDKDAAECRAQGSGEATDAHVCLAGSLCSAADRTHSCDSFNRSACNTVDSSPDPNNYNACFLVFEESFNSCVLPAAEEENAGMHDSTNSNACHQVEEEQLSFEYFELRESVGLHQDEVNPLVQSSQRIIVYRLRVESWKIC